VALPAVQHGCEVVTLRNRNQAAKLEFVRSLTKCTLMDRKKNRMYRCPRWQNARIFTSTLPHLTDVVYYGRKGPLFVFEF